MTSNLILQKNLIICMGAGGVGKTTTSAAFGLAAARAGRRTLVVTIDPAPRLADAFGLQALTPTPAPLASERLVALGNKPDDALFVARIDTRTAFDRLVCAELRDPERQQRVLANPIYKQITTSLPGVQEYAAMLTLSEIQRSSWDLVVLDTPPASNALEFLSAPSRLLTALENPVLRWLAKEKSGRANRFSLGAIRAGGSLTLKLLGRLAGSTFLGDLATFLRDFEGAFKAIANKAAETQRLFLQGDVAAVVVLHPEAFGVQETLALLPQLARHGLSPKAFIANRLRPPSPALRENDIAQLFNQTGERGAKQPGPEADPTCARQFAELLEDNQKLFEAQRQGVAALERQVAPVPVIAVPNTGEDGDPSTILTWIADHFSGELPRTPSETTEERRRR